MNKIKFKNVHIFTSLAKNRDSRDFSILALTSFGIFYFLGTGSKKRNGPKNAKLKKKKSRYGSDPRSSPFDFD